MVKVSMTTRKFGLISWAVSRSSSTKSVKFSWRHSTQSRNVGSVKSMRLGVARPVVEWFSAIDHAAKAAFAAELVSDHGTPVDR